MRLMGMQIKFPIPTETLSKTIRIDMKPNRLSISIPNISAPTVPLNECDNILGTGGCALFGTIRPGKCLWCCPLYLDKILNTNPDSSTWSLDVSEKSKFVAITLEKASSTLKWERLTRDL